MYNKIYSYENLLHAFKKARKGKTKKRYVKRFGKNIKENLLKLQKELTTQTYKPKRLKTFILRDPKTRKISKSAFRDRVIHHAVINIIGQIFEREFIYDSHANQIGKGTLKAIERFDKFKRKVSKNNTKTCYVLKADIKHYFDEITHNILLSILRRKISDEKVIWIVTKILRNAGGGGRRRFCKKGMPLGNLTSQFFANVYLNELDQFVKHKLKAKHYIRYVDDFVLFHQSKDQLTKWKAQIRKFLKRELNLELHPNKSNTLTFNNGITFLGFKIFFHHRLLRKSNVNNFDRKFNQLKFLFKAQTISRAKALESFEGWLNYASHANTYKYRKHLVREFNKHFPLTSNKQIGNKKKHTNFMRKLNQSELKFSVQKTLFLFNKNLSIQGIAKERQIKESTVWQHLAELIKFKQIPLRSVVSDKKIRRILSKVYSKKDKLKEIKRRLKDDSISYDEIYCVLASIK